VIEEAKGYIDDVSGSIPWADLMARYDRQRRR